MVSNTVESGWNAIVVPVALEVIDNSIDEALAGYCDRIDVTMTEDGSCVVKDNGRGIPTGINKEEGISGVELAL